MLFCCLYTGFSDGRKVHIVRDEDELFIPEFDLKQILPSLDRQLTIRKIKINSVKIINDESHPHVFIDALRFVIIEKLLIKFKWLL